jgi:hypothetical protein
MKTIKILFFIFAIFIASVGLVSASSGSGSVIVNVVIVPTYTVTATATSGGTITPASQIVNKDSEAVFNVTPISTTDYITTVTGCNGTLAPFTNPGTTYTTGPITANCTVSAVFTRKATPPTTPMNFNATVGACGTNKITLSWTASSGATSYTVKDGSTTIYTGAGTSYAQTGLTPGSVHNSYSIYASNAVGNSSTYNIPASFTAPPLCTINGVCSTTSLTACTSGTSSGSSGCGQYGCTWTCFGSNGGTDASCSGAIGSCATTHYNCTSGTSVNNVSGASSWTWNCNGTNGGPNVSCSQTKPVMSGTITPSSTSCTIASGASSCNVNLTWSTTNPIGTSAVTADGMSNVNGNSGSQSFSVPYNSRTFYLYNNGTQLDSTYASANCVNGTAWINGSCETTTVMSGWINASSCTITEGNNSCSTNVSWSTSNPESTSAVTASGMTNVNGNSGSQSMTVPYNQRTFYLYNNGTELDSIWAGASCESGTEWNGDSCETTAVMSGWINASDCTIEEGNNSCSTTVSWDTYNPESTSAVTANEMSNVNGNSGSQSMTVPYNQRTFYLYNNAVELGSVWVGASCGYGTIWDEATSSCILSSSPIDGGWDNGTCGVCDVGTGYQECTKLCNNPAPQNGGANCPGDTTGGGVWNYQQFCGSGGPIDGDGGTGIFNVTFTATPDTVFKGRSSTLTWTSSADSCTGTGFSTGGKANSSELSSPVIVTPKVTTTYTLICNGETDQQVEQQQVQVNSIKVIER